MPIETPDPTPRERGPGDRIAKLLARAGIASRREVERMIAEGRVALDGVAIDTPATLLTSLAGVTVDGQPVAAPAAARLFVYHKPVGLLVTERDPAGRPTIYDRLPEELPRVVPVGRLDLATEGLLLLTTDGGLKRQLELPATGVKRTYRARAYGPVSQAQLEELIHGIEIEGMRYGPIDANLERRTGANGWIEMSLTEGKNREVRRVLEYLGLEVSRLIRTRYGPFELGELAPGEVGEIRQHDLEVFRKTLKRSGEAPGAAMQAVVAQAMVRPVATQARPDRSRAASPAGREGGERRPAAATGSPRRAEGRDRPAASDAASRERRPSSSAARGERHGARGDRDDTTARDANARPARGDHRADRSRPSDDRARAAASARASFPARASSPAGDRRNRTGASSTGREDRPRTFGDRSRPAGGPRSSAAGNRDERGGTGSAGRSDRAARPAGRDDRPRGFGDRTRASAGERERAGEDGARQVDRGPLGGRDDRQRDTVDRPPARRTAQQETPRGDRPARPARPGKPAPDRSGSLSQRPERSSPRPPTDRSRGPAGGRGKPQDPRRPKTPPRGKR